MSRTDHCDFWQLKDLENIKTNKTEMTLARVQTSTKAAHNPKVL